MKKKLITTVVILLVIVGIWCTRLVTNSYTRVMTEKELNKFQIVSSYLEEKDYHIGAFEIADYVKTSYGKDGYILTEILKKEGFVFTTA